ncbi:MAG: pilus assembly protein CpaE [Actinomycetales bacterium]|nr:pilus assembly protein CpaE [Actinomycetales bacterium]
MITVELAEALQRAGLPWSPRSGDRFVIPHRSIDDTVFHVAEMTIEVHDHFGQGVVKFNGTTEWALDSIPQEACLWLPREDQLREALGESLVALEHDGPRWIVTFRTGEGLRRTVDDDVECGYARALLALLDGGH